MVSYLIVRILCECGCFPSKIKIRDHKTTIVLDDDPGHPSLSFCQFPMTFMMLSIKAGLAALDEPISREDAKDFEKMAYVLAKQKPNWEPGTKSGSVEDCGVRREFSECVTCFSGTTRLPLAGSSTR